MKLNLIILAIAVAFVHAPAASAMQSVEPNPKSPGEKTAERRAEYQLALEELETASASHLAARQLRDQFIKTANESAEEKLLLEQIGKMENEIAENALISEENILSLLTARRVELIIDIAGLNAKLEHVLKLDSEQRADRSEISEKIVQAQQQQLILAKEKLDRVHSLHSAGTVPQAEVKQAELDVAKAELAWLEKRKALEQPKKDEAQVEIGLELAEKKSQLQTVQELLKQAASMRKSIAELTETKTRWYQIRSAREYGRMETLKEVESGLTEYQLYELRARQQLEELETKEQENEDEQD